MQLDGWLEIRAERCLSGRRLGNRGTRRGVSLSGDLGSRVGGLWLSRRGRGNFLHQTGPSEQEYHADGDNDDSGAIHEK